MDGSPINEKVDETERRILQLPEIHQGPSFDSFGMFLVHQFKARGSIEYLDCAIRMHEKAVTLTPIQYPDYPKILNNLAIAQLERFLKTRIMQDIEPVIATSEQLLQSIPNDHPSYGLYLRNLGIAVERRYEQTGSIEDINRAVTTYEESIRHTPSNSSRFAMCLNSLAAVLYRRFQSTGILNDLDQAVQTIEQAKLMVPEGDSQFYMIIDTWSRVLLGKFKQANELDSLNSVITQNQHVMKMITRDTQYYDALFATLFDSLMERFQQSHLIDDLDHALEIVRQEIEATVEGGRNPARLLRGYGWALRVRSEWTNSLEDLTLAVSTLTDSVSASLISNDKVEYVTSLRDLGFALYKKFEYTSSMEDINSSILKLNEVISLIPLTHPDQIGVLNNLSTALFRRFERTAAIEDLDDAIKATERIVSLTPDDSFHYLSYVGNLASYMEAQFQHTGSVDDLDRSIALFDQMASIPETDTDRARLTLANFSGLLQKRFHQSGSAEDIDRAVATMLAIDPSSLRHDIDRAEMHNTLACALLNRFPRSLSLNDLTRAISIAQSAVTMTPQNHPLLPQHLITLGVGLAERFNQNKSIQDLTQAIETVEKAIELTPSDNVARSGQLLVLGSCLYNLYEQTKEPKTLDRAIALSEECVTTTPDGDFRRGGNLNLLGSMLATRFDRFKSNQDLDRAIWSKEQAFMNTSEPSFRLMAAESAANWLKDRDPVRAKELLQAAVELLPIIAPRTLSRSDQQYSIARFAKITSRAVSLVLECGEEPYNGLRLLELGRGVLASLLIEVRSDISILEEQHPALAEEFRELRDKLDTPQSSVELTNLTHMIRDSGKVRRSLSKRFDDQLQIIRTLPGCERFLLGASELQILEAAQTGAIVVFNISDIRSDAFLVYGCVRSFKLSQLSLSDLEAYAARFLTAIGDLYSTDYMKARREVNRVLMWLWNVAVGPILEELGFTHSPQPGQTWPRVWWVGSGLLNILPLHAAGNHESDVNALDRVVSSYIPTIKALTYARERQSRTNNLEKQKVVIVGMPETSSESDLPFVKDEMNMLQELIPRCINCTVLACPTRESVLNTIIDHQVVHLACHGRSRLDPSQSMFMLKDWKSSPLTVSDIISRNLPNSQFAYLSACQTAKMEDFQLLDESISLACAIQLSGFPAVVGALWQVSDRESVELSRNVYEWMLGAGDKFDNARSAEGLHRAVRLLRDKTRFVKGLTGRGRNDPIVWAPYIHLGI